MKGKGHEKPQASSSTHGQQGGSLSIASSSNSAAASTGASRLTQHHSDTGATGAAAPIATLEARIVGWERELEEAENQYDADYAEAQTSRQAEDEHVINLHEAIARAAPDESTRDLKAQLSAAKQKVRRWDQTMIALERQIEQKRYNYGSLIEHAEGSLASRQEEADRRLYNQQYDPAHPSFAMSSAVGQFAGERQDDNGSTCSYGSPWEIGASDRSDDEEMGQELPASLPPMGERSRPVEGTSTPGSHAIPELEPQGSSLRIAHVRPVRLRTMGGGSGDFHGEYTSLARPHGGDGRVESDSVERFELRGSLGDQNVNTNGPPQELE